MSKPMIISATCGANAIAAKDFLEADGSGDVKAFDGTGVVLGIAASAKDSENRCGCIKQGLLKVPTTNAAYDFGDELEWVADQKVQAKSAGVTVGRAAESKTTDSADNLLKCYFNFA